MPILKKKVKIYAMQFHNFGTCSPKELNVFA